MKKLLPFVFVGAAALGLAAWMPASSTSRPTLTAADGALEESMEQMNGCLKSLLKGINAETKDKALETLAKMQSAVLVAKLEKPHDLKPEELLGYRRMLVDLLALTCRVEGAVLDGKFDDANKLVKEELTKLKKDGHDKFQKEEKH